MQWQTLKATMSQPWGLACFYTQIKKKITIVATIALFLTPNVVCEKQHNVILNKNRLFFNPSVLILKTLYLSRSSDMFKVSFTNNCGRNYSNFFKSTRKSKTGRGFHVHLIFSPCQFYRQLEAILQLACLWCFDRKRFAFCVSAVSFKHRENSRMGYLWKRLLITKESKQQMLNSALHLVKNEFSLWWLR